MKKPTFKSKIIRFSNQKGFTLIELISIMVIMSMMFTVAVKKFNLVSDAGSINALSYGIRELNTRETVSWSKIKLSDSGWTNDNDVYSTVDKNLGDGYIWNPAPNSGGGTLHFKSQNVALNRTASTINSMGVWK